MDLCKLTASKYKMNKYNMSEDLQQKKIFINHSKTLENNKYNE